MKKYLVRIKTYEDIQTSPSYCVLEENQILYILVGLSTKYDLIVTLRMKIYEYPMSFLFCSTMSIGMNYIMLIQMVSHQL